MIRRDTIRRDTATGGGSAGAPPHPVVVIVPGWPTPPEAPSGGDRYNGRVCDALAASGWSPRIREVAGAWPGADRAARDRLERVLAEIPDGATVLADGIVVSGAAEVTMRHARRLALVVVVHLPLGEDLPGHRTPGGAVSERGVLAGARGVIATSEWTRGRLLERHHLDPAAVRVVHPGSDPAPRAAGTAGGGELVCVAAVSPHKGQDVLLAALALLGGRPWRCRLVGPLGRDPAFVARLRAAAARPPLRGRVEFAGALTGSALGDAYAAADLLLVPSRAETYGMVVTEALARGVPVIASDVGGIPEAMDAAPDGRLPGVLVGPDDPRALAAALGKWLDSPEVRRDLRAAAARRREGLGGWRATGDAVGAALRDAESALVSAPATGPVRTRLPPGPRAVGARR